MEKEGGIKENFGFYISEAQKPGKDIRKLLKEVIGCSSGETYIEISKLIILGSENIGKREEEIGSLGVKSGVCGKIIYSHDILWFCDTCGINKNSGICQQCYADGNHLGHHTYFRRNFIGCCDCGDPDAWTLQGSCVKHQGFDESKIDCTLLGNQSYNAAKQVFYALFSHLNKLVLNIQLENLQNAPGEQASPFEGVFMNKIEKEELQVLNLFEFFHYLVDLSPIFQKMLTDQFEKIHFRHFKHECNLKKFQSKVKEGQFNENMEYLNSKDKSKDICTCNVLENLLKITHFTDEYTCRAMAELFVKMSKNPRFKSILCFSYILNYSTILGKATSSRYSLEDDMQKIPLQTFTIDELALSLFSDKRLLKLLLSVLNKIMESCSESTLPEEEERNLLIQSFTFWRNFTYLLKPSSSKHLIHKTGFLETFLHIVSQTQYSNSLQCRKTHISYDSEGISSRLPVIFKHVISVFKNIVVNYDYANLKLCNLLAAKFKELFGILEEKLRGMRESQRFAYYTIQIQRCFAYFLVIYVMAALIRRGELERKEGNVGEFGRNVREIVMQVMGFRESEELRRFIEGVCEGLLNVVGFFIEVSARKWVYYGFHAENLLEYYYQKGAYVYSVLDYSLIQILMACYGDVDNFIHFIFTHLSTDKSLHQYFAYLKTKDDSIFKKNNIDEKKLVEQIERTLHFFCNICVDDRNILTILLRLSSPILRKLEYKEALNPTIDELLDHYLRRQLAQNIMKNQNSITFSDFQSSLPKKMRQNPRCEKVISEITKSKRNTQGKTTFSLKSEYLCYFEPFSFTRMTDIAEADDSIQTMIKKVSDPKIFNPLLGGLNSNPTENDRTKYFHFPNLLSLRFSQTTFLSYLIKIINLDANSAICSDALKINSLKLIQIYVQNFNNLEEKQQKFILDSFSENDSIFISNMTKIKDESPFNKAFLSDLVNSIEKLQEKELKTSEREKKVEENFEEEKKISALERKNKMKAMQDSIRSQFASKQQAFFSKHKEQLSEISTEEETVKLKEEEVVCASCKEKLDKHHPHQQFGKIIYISPTKLLLLAKKQSYQIQHLSEKEIRNQLDLLFLNEKTMCGVATTSCDHYMHFECFVNYLHNNFYNPKYGFRPNPLEFLCPICKSLSNSLVPVVTTETSLSKTLNSLEMFLFAYFFVQKGDSEMPYSYFNDGNNGEEFFNLIMDIVNHHISLIDVNGLASYLKQIDIMLSFLEAGELCSGIFKNSSCITNLQEENSLSSESLFSNRARLMINNTILTKLSKSEIQIKISVLDSQISENFLLTLLQILLKLTPSSPTSPSIPEAEQLLQTLTENTSTIKSLLLPFLRKAFALFLTLTPASPQLLTKILNNYTSSTNTNTDSDTKSTNPNIERIINIETEYNFLTSLLPPSPYYSLTNDIILTFLIDMQKYCKDRPSQRRMSYVFKGLDESQFGFIKLEETFDQCVLSYYGKECVNCGVKVKEQALCLICGNVVSVANACGCENQGKGELTLHSAQCGGGTGIWLLLFSGEVVFIDRERAAGFGSMYLSKFGECAHVLRDQEQSYYFSEESYQKIKNLYMQSRIPQSVIYQKINNDKTYRDNVL